MKQIYLICLLGSMVLLFSFGCRTNNPFKPENIELTKLSFSSEKIPISGSSEFTYIQTAVWNGESDPDSRFAWRICTSDSLLPDGIVTDEQGWIYHYTIGGNTQIPLSQPGPHRTIWTSSGRQDWEFTSVNNQLLHIVTRVEVQVSKSGVVQETIALPFRDNRIIGSQIIAPFNDGATTGQGLRFVFRERITDIFVEGMYTHHFMYRLNILDDDGNTIVNGSWYNSINCTDIHEVLLNRYTTPGLNANSVGTLSQLEVYAVTSQGIEESTHQTLTFFVNAGYHAKALLYISSITALGQYHFTTVPLGGWLGQVNTLGLPSNDNVHFPTPLFKENDTYCAINSPDLVIQLSWGWHGQYGLLQPNGSIITTDNPYDTLVNNTLDESTNQAYSSTIDFFDLRLNNQPFPDLYFIEHNIVTHSDGTRWLRIPNKGLVSQRVALNNLSTGLHSFEVTVVDSQTEIDPTPAIFNFRLDPFITANNRTGILIVDDDQNNNTFCPDDSVDMIYQNMIPDTYGQVAHFDLSQTQYSDFMNRKITPNLLQHYKAVVYHDDYVTSSMYFIFETDAFSIYLESGGNLIVSGGSNVSVCLKGISHSNPRFYHIIVGDAGQENISCVSNNYIASPFFVTAESEYPPVPDIQVDTESSYSSLINYVNGISPISYFDEMPQNTMLYMYGCKLPGADNFSPTQDVYDLLSTKYVGYLRDTGPGKVAIFGFPLSLMQREPMQMAMQNILIELFSIGKK